MIKLRFPYEPKGKSKVYSIGDIVKANLKANGIDCDKQKWLPPGCKERQKALNRFKIRI